MAADETKDVVTAIHVATRKNRAFVFLLHEDGDITLQLREYSDRHGVFEDVESQRVSARHFADRITDLQVPRWGEHHRPVLLQYNRRNFQGSPKGDE